MKKQIALAFALSWSALSGALAQSQDDQQACMNDAFQFCQNAIPDHTRVFNCLVENRNQISVGCHNVLSPYLPVDVPVKKPVAAARPKSNVKGAKSPKSKGPLNLSPP